MNNELEYVYKNIAQFEKDLVSVPPNFVNIYKNLVRYDENHSNRFDINKVTSLFTQMLIEAGTDPLDYLKEMPRYYFSNSNISEYSIPNDVKNVAEESFSGCARLQHIDIPNSVKVIDDCAFFGCISLIQINVPKSVKTIGSFVFDDSGISVINYGGTMGDFSKVLIGKRDFGEEEYIEIACSDGTIYMKSNGVYAEV